MTKTYLLFSQFSHVMVLRDHHCFSESVDGMYSAMIIWIIKFLTLMLPCMFHWQGLHQLSDHTSCHMYVTTFSSTNKSQCWHSHVPLQVLLGLPQKGSMTWFCCELGLWQQCICNTDITSVVLCRYIPDLPWLCTTPNQQASESCPELRLLFQPPAIYDIYYEKNWNLQLPPN